MPQMLKGNDDGKTPKPEVSSIDGSSNKKMSRKGHGKRKRVLSKPVPKTKSYLKR